MGIREDIQKLHDENEEKEKKLRREEDGRGTRPESIMGMKEYKDGTLRPGYNMEDLNLEDAQNERDEEANTLEKSEPDDE